MQECTSLKLFNQFFKQLSDTLIKGIQCIKRLTEEKATINI